MQEIRYPYFQKDRILKIEMLENLRDFPRNMTEVFLNQYSDGILWGFSPTVEKNQICFSKGALKHRGEIYVTQSPIMAAYGQSEELVVIKLCMGEKQKSPDFSSVKIEIQLDNKPAVRGSQMELGRFQLKKGAYLRLDYTDLYDFATAYNTLDFVDALYAGIGKATISPAIVKYFSLEALKAKSQNPVDLSFCFTCLNSPLIERDAINAYLAYRLAEPLQDYSNREIHQKLVQILGSIRRETGGKEKMLQNNRKIIVD